MGLVLSMREGEDFYVADDQFVVTEQSEDAHFKVRRVADGKEFRVTDAMAVELAPDVYAAAGEQHLKGVVRIVIDAPRDKLIIRGDKKRNPPENVS